MSPNPKPGSSAETPEEIDRRERAALAKAVRMILSWPEPSREPEETLPELPEESDKLPEGVSRVLDFILSYPMPSREPKPEEAVRESPGDSAEIPEAVTELRDPPLSLAERIGLTYDTGELLAFRTKRGSVFHLLETWREDPGSTLIRSYCLSPGEAYIPYDSIRAWITIPDIWPEEFEDNLCRKCLRLFTTRDPGSPEEEYETD